MKKQIGTKKERFEVILEDVKSKFDFLAEHLSLLHSKVDKLSNDINVMKEDIDMIKSELNLMRGLLKRKVDIDEFEALEKRVRKLEGRRYA